MNDFIRLINEEEKKKGKLACYKCGEVPQFSIPEERIFLCKICVKKNMEMCVKYINKLLEE